MLGNTVIRLYKYWTTIASCIRGGKILFTKTTICSPYIVDEQIFELQSFKDGLEVVCSHKMMLNVTVPVVSFRSLVSWPPCAAQSAALGGCVG